MDMKKIKTFLVVFIMALAVLNAKDYNVSFFIDKAIPKIKYTIKSGEKKTVVNFSSIYKVASDDKIYVEFNAGSEFIHITSIKLRSYDGEGGINEVKHEELKTDEEGTYFMLGDLGILVEWSVEPILKRDPIKLDLKSLSNGKPVKGTWMINGRSGVTDGEEISSINDFAVSFKYDGDVYYIVSSTPKKLAESNGKVIFAIQKVGKETSPITKYEIELDQYRKISLGEKENKFIKIDYNDYEYKKDDLEKLKLKKGESFYVYTKKGYTVANDNGLELVKSKLVDEQMETQVKVPEDSNINSYVINICEEKEAKFPIILTGFSENDNLDSIQINISGNDQETKDYLNNKDKEITIKEGDNFTIIIPKGTLREKYSIVFDDLDGSLDKYNTDDTIKEFTGEFTYDDVKSLLQIEIKKESGYRIKGIQKKIDDAKKYGVDVKFYLNGAELKDEKFLSCGDKVTIKLNVPEDIIAKLGDTTFTDTENQKEIKVSENTQNSDFNLEFEDKNGFWYDFGDGTKTLENGSVTYKRKGNESKLEGNKFIAVGETIKIVAKPDDGYIADFGNGNVGGDYEFEIKTEDDKNNLENIKFIKDEDIKTVTVVLYQPKYGRVNYTNDKGTIKECDDNSDVYGTLVRTLKDENNQAVELSYKYDYVTSGFSRPQKSKDSEDYSGKVSFNKGETTKDFKPEECIENKESKPELKLKIGKNLKQNAENLNIYYYGEDSKQHFFYKNSKKEDKKEERITTTKPLELVVEQQNILEGMALEFRYTVKYKSEEVTTSINRTKKYNNYTKMPEIKEHISERNKSCDVTKIIVELDLIEAKEFKEITIENATVTVKIGEDVLNSSSLVSDDDDITLIVKPKEGYYIEGQETSLEKTIKYKDLEKELERVKIKKYVNVRLINIHPQKGKGSIYEKDGGILRLGTYQFREGEKITIKLENVKGYKSSNIINNISSFIKKGEISKTIKITRSMDNKTLTLKDFGIKKE